MSDSTDSDSKQNSVSSVTFGQETTEQASTFCHESIASSQKGVKRQIDEVLMKNDELQKLEARRAYNRKCAANARKRSKELISSLQVQVEQLTQDKAELQRRNDVMRAQLELLEVQNRTLLMNQRQPQASANANMDSGAHQQHQNLTQHMNAPQYNFPQAAPNFLSAMSAASGIANLSQFQVLEALTAATRNSNACLMNTTEVQDVGRCSGQGMDPKYYFGKNM